MISILSFLGTAVAFAVAGWARLKLKSVWVKVLFFFVAVIAGNVVYLGLGIAWALTNTATVHAVAQDVGRNGWGVLASTIVGAIVGLVSSLPDRFRLLRKSNLGSKARE